MLETEPRLEDSMSDTRGSVKAPVGESSGRELHKMEPWKLGEVFGRYVTSEWARVGQNGRSVSSSPVGKAASSLSS